MAAKQFSRPGRMWFVSDGYIWDDHSAQTRREVSGGPVGATGVSTGGGGAGPGRPLECSSKLFVYNPQAKAAGVTARFYHTDRAPTSLAFPVPPGAVHELELAALNEIPHRQAFWITIESDLPVLPQARHEDFTFWDVVPDAMVAVAPYPGPLEDETSWMLIDCFQGDCGSWYERESITILNPGPEPASVRVRYLFRGGGGAEETVQIPAGRVAWLHGEDRFPKVIGEEGALGASGSTPLAVNNLMARLRWEYNVRIDADRPVIAQSTRRARWVGFPSIIGSRSTMAIPVRADWPDRWYFPGGEIVDYGLLPRPKADTHALNQCDNTWNLLFIANRDSRRPVQARLTIHKPGGQALDAEPMTVPSDRTVLQCLHAKPWLGPYTKVGEPFAMTVTGDGTLAPSVCGAEFEMWSQVCPGAMTAVNFYGGPLTDEKEWWLGIGHAGGSDDCALEWRQSYHLFNPGEREVRVTLSFVGLGSGQELSRAFTLAPGGVARVTNAEIPGLPMGKPLAVRAVGDGPFCAQVYGRSFTRGMPHPRAMYSFIGVPMRLA